LEEAQLVVFQRQVLVSSFTINLLLPNKSSVAVRLIFALLAFIGLVAYPGQGICKTLRTITHSKTSKSIIEARHREGQWLLEGYSRTSAEAEDVVSKFNNILQHADNAENLARNQQNYHC
jgi:hypothetical protein